MLQSNVGGVSVGFWWYGHGFIAYARKSCEISQGLEIENPSMWQAEGIVVPTSNKPQKLLLLKVARVLYKSNDNEKT